MTSYNIAEALDFQASACRLLGSPFTSALLNGAAENYRADGIAHSILHDWPDDPVAHALALRFAAALHWLVLTGKAPNLAEFYPPHKADEHDGTIWRQAASTAANHVDAIRTFIRKPIQTNEVGRSAPLMLGFLDTARRTNLPLRLLELGASGGLNQHWDRFCYNLSGSSWGDRKSPLHLKPVWKGASPDTDISVTIASRNGCDIRPVNYTDEEEVLRTLSFIWPDQAERLERFKAAVDLFRQRPLQIDQADAADWLEDKLAKPVAGVATVVFHSVVWHYFPEENQKRISELLRVRGAQARADAPIAWLRMEPEDPKAIPDIRITYWPNGETQRLCWCHPHGTSIDYSPTVLDV